MSSVNGGQQDVDIDLGQVGSAVWQRKGRILTIAVAAAVLALGASMAIKPSYKGEARLIIESRSSGVTGGDAATSGNDPILDSLNITSQAQLLQSTDLIRRVARELKLSQIKEFDPAAQSILPDPLVMIGLRQDPMKLDPEDRVIQEFRSKLEVYAVENSRVIAIEFSSHDPKLAAAIPNKMAEIYLQLQSGAKLDTHEETAKWLEPEIASLTQKVKDAEKKVADYRSSNGLFQATDASNFSTKQLNDISTELARVRSDRANAEARAENVRAAIKAGRSTDTLSDVVSSQVIQRLKEAQTNLQAQINDLSTTLLPGHPRLRGLQAQLAGIRQQIDVETKKILASLDNDAEMARLREKQLMDQLDQVKAASGKAGEEEVGLRSLEREAAAQRQLLETYLSRYREATSRMDADSAPADARIVSSAVEPSEPYFPKIVPIVVVVTLLALIGSCLFIIVSELFSGRGLRPSGPSRNRELVPSVADNDTVTVVARAPVLVQPVARPLSPAAAIRAALPWRSAGEAEAENLQASALRAEEADAVIAAEETAQHMPSDRASAATAAPVVAEQPHHPAGDADEPAVEEAEVFSTASVARYLHRRGVPLAIALSPSGDSGSTATVMLAREIAEQGRSVILVDMSGTACPTRLMAPDEKAAGITDLLCGEAAFGDAIHRDRLSDAHIVPHGASDAERAMRGADRLMMIVDALTDAYDVVLVECGAADLGSLGRITRSKQTDIILSVPGMDDEKLAAFIVEVEAEGFEHVLVMTGSEASQRRSGREAA